MPYDFYTDVRNLTNNQGLTTTMIDWAVRLAKTFYVAGDPATYDDSKAIDNVLVSMLAGGFIALNTYGAFNAGEFSLDELTIKESSGDGRSEQYKFFKMFFDWLALYLLRDVDLQYVDSSSLMQVSVFDPTIYLVDRDAVSGLEA